MHGEHDTGKTPIVVGSKNNVNTTLEQKMISVSQKVNQTQTQVINPGSVLLTYIQSPSHPLEIFL